MNAPLGLSISSKDAQTSVLLFYLHRDWLHHDVFHHDQHHDLGKWRRLPDRNLTWFPLSYTKCLLTNKWMVPKCTWRLVLLNFLPSGHSRLLVLCPAICIAWRIYSSTKGCWLIKLIKCCAAITGIHESNFLILSTMSTYKEKDCPLGQWFCKTCTPVA